jgi:hypothetical protein
MGFYTKEYKIVNWMRSHVTHYVDPITLEVNATKLAEDAFLELYIDDAEDEIPELYFEVAEKIAYDHENGVK